MQKAHSTPDARATLNDLQATTESLRATQARVNQRLDSVDATVQGITDVFARWDAMKARFDAAHRRFCERLAESLRDEANAEPPADVPPAGIFAHGGMVPASSLPPPRLAAQCDDIARPNSLVQMKAHEYLDLPDALDAKVKVLAAMVRASRHTVVLSGAGISTSAGIRDYASKAGTRSVAAAGVREHSQGTPFEPKDSIDARPTLAHRALAAMHRAGLVQGWVNQNHDGLAQRAGMPQSAVTEIHGSWLDPTNPVVPMQGALKASCAQALHDHCERADLVVCLGTSLSGLSADRLASRAGRQAEAEGFNPEGQSLGVAIIALQQTRLDGVASVRIFERCDVVMEALARELGVRVPREAPASQAAAVAHGEAMWTLPMDALTGVASPSAQTVLDLRPGARVRLASGNAPLASEGARGTVIGRTRSGDFCIRVDPDDVEVEAGESAGNDARGFDSGAQGRAQGRSTALGAWWIDEALRGGIEHFPLVPAGASTAAGYRRCQS